MATADVQWHHQSTLTKSSRVQLLLFPGQLSCIVSRYSIAPPFAHDAAGTKCPLGLSCELKTLEWHGTRAISQQRMRSPAGKHRLNAAHRGLSAVHGTVTLTCDESPKRTTSCCGHASALPALHAGFLCVRASPPFWRALQPCGRPRLGAKPPEAQVASQAQEVNPSHPPPRLQLLP